MCGGRGDGWEPPDSVLYSRWEIQNMGGWEDVKMGWYEGDGRRWFWGMGNGEMG